MGKKKEGSNGDGKSTVDGFESYSTVFAIKNKNPYLMASSMTLRKFGTVCYDSYGAREEDLKEDGKYGSFVKYLKERKLSNERGR